MPPTNLAHLGAAGFAVALSFSACGPGGAGNGGAENWPDRPITISCFAAAGGGTDLVSRLVAKELGDVLGAKINVVNRTGGRGAAAINHVAQAKRDGYQWGGFSESVLPAPVLGITDTTADDWAFFMVAGAPGVLSVQPGSPFKSLDDLVTELKAAPRSVKAAASVTGGVWHTKLLALEKAAGVAFQYIPFKGSQPSQLAALSGEVDVVLTSISEQADLIRGGKLRPLAMVEPNPYEFPRGVTIPAAGETFPAVADVPVDQFLGFALPSDTDPAILAEITSAFATMMASPAVAEFASSRELGLLGYHGEEAASRARAAESAWAWMLHDLGVAVKAPDAFGIVKP
jgi:tripartite-type tricarboxylate transporter receptor subunit TctC